MEINIKANVIHQQRLITLETNINLYLIAEINFLAKWTKRVLGAIFRGYHVKSPY